MFRLFVCYKISIDNYSRGNREGNRHHRSLQAARKNRRNIWKSNIALVTMRKVYQHDLWMLCFSQSINSCHVSMFHWLCNNSIGKACIYIYATAATNKESNFCEIYWWIIYEADIYIEIAHDSLSFDLYFCTLCTDIGCVFWNLR